jgi:hypothetical protein
LLMMAGIGSILCLIAYLLRYQPFK